MTPVKSKSNEKLGAKVSKEQAKLSSATPNSGNSATSCAYNLDSGTSHTFEHQSGRFRTLDETEEHAHNSFGVTGEFDLTSNHNSYRSELEEKEKTTGNAALIEPIPGCDTDKREKIRQKNEKKHQRQKERRAQELHERCSGYLMSRKLEILAQKMVAMGFSSEQATMALIQNEGHVEESIAWLLEISDESREQIAATTDVGASLKIDITAEIAKISEMEMKFKCTKQEVQRAVVLHEGNLEKAEESLKSNKQEPKVVSSPLEESGGPAIASDLDIKPVNTFQISVLRNQLKEMDSVGTQQQRRVERDINLIKTQDAGTADSSIKNLQALRKILPKPDWGRSQTNASVDNRWPSTNPAPFVSHTLPSQASILPTTRYAMASTEAKVNMPSGTFRETVVMQRPQLINAKLNAASTSVNANALSSSSTGWYSNGTSSTVDKLKVANGSLEHSFVQLGMNGSSAQQFLPHKQFQTASSCIVESSSAVPWNPAGSGSSSASLTTPSSLGLFTGWGSSGTSSSLDWSSGGSMSCDYTSIDWSLDRNLLRTPMKSEGLSDTWSTMFMGGKAARPLLSQPNSVRMPGLQDGSIAPDMSYSSGIGSRELSTPFPCKDLFTIPRQFQ